jgi:hypothetical protein
MAIFPKSETEVIGLTQKIISGLRANPEVFPNPPYTPDMLTAKLQVFVDSRDAATAAASAAVEATSNKNASFVDLQDVIKNVLRYAEYIVNNNDNLLRRLGWGAKAPKSPTEVPGQPRALEAPRRGEGWIYLDWKEPLDGGYVQAYIIQRREMKDGKWMDIHTVPTHEAMLLDQPRMKDLEYRVFAMNRTGNGESSSIVATVL